METVLFVKEAIASPWKPRDTLFKSAPELSYCSCPLFQAIRSINKNKFENTHFLPLSLKKKDSLTSQNVPYYSCQLYSKYETTK